MAASFCRETAERVTSPPAFIPCEKCKFESKKFAKAQKVRRKKKNNYSVTRHLITKFN